MRTVADMTMVILQGGNHAAHTGIRIQGEMSRLMDKVARTGEGMLSTKNGKPVAELRLLAG